MNAIAEFKLTPAQVEALRCFDEVPLGTYKEAMAVKASPSAARTLALKGLLRVNSNVAARLGSSAASYALTPIGRRVARQVAEAAYLANLTD